MAAIQYDSMQIKTNVNSDQVTKVDEIEIIANLYSFFADKQLYLTDLFTQRMMEWVTGCIKADVCPDLYSEWMHSKDDADHFRDVINDRNAQINDRDVCIKDLRDRIKAMEGHKEELKLTIGERDTSIKNDAKTMQDLQDIVTDLSEGVLSYQEDAEEHANEINKLKAQLWDLTKEQLIREWGTGGV